MWKCPKCGRTFKNREQSHFCGKAPETIEEYILDQPETVRPYLYQVNSAIKEALPDAVEKIAWSMPTYWKGGNLIQFAACKKHIGLYTGEDAVEAFSEYLKDYKVNKGTIQFPYDQYLPTELIAKIAKWCEVHA